MRILISGGAGFLGSHLADMLVKRGDEVVVVDDLSTSKDSGNVPRDAVFIKKEIEGFRPTMHFDVVAHLAARPSPEDYIRHPVKTLLSNSMGTRNMLEIAKKYNSVFLYTSSSEVYGNAEKLPTPEDYWGYVNPNGIRSCYDEGKRFSEALIMAYHRQYGVDSRIQRPFNVYGPRIRADSTYGRVIPRFITQALAGKPITVHGDGRQTRSFLYIKDWLDATGKMISKKKIGGSILNIGSNDEIPIMELAGMIKKLTGSSSKLVHEKGREDDPRRRSADLTKVSKALGWKPKIQLRQGLKFTIEWFRGRS